MTQSLITDELIGLAAKPLDKVAAIRQAGQLLVDAGYIAPAYVDSLLAREKAANTFLGQGVAIPHGVIADRHMIFKTGIAVLQVPDGVVWNDGQVAHLIFAIAAQSDEHLSLLRRLTRLLGDEKTLTSLYKTSDRSEIIHALTLDFAPAAQSAAQDFSKGFDWVLDYPNGLHARPAQQWVETARRFSSSIRVRVGDESADGKNLISLLQLGAGSGARLFVSAQGPDADAALEAVYAVMQKLVFSEKLEAQKAANALQDTQQLVNAWKPKGGALSIQAISASPGLAIGTLKISRAHDFDVPNIELDLATNADILESAFAKTRAALLALEQDTAKRIGKTEGQIFKAQAMLLDDTDLVGATCKLMAEGNGAAWSWNKAISDMANSLSNVGNSVLAARAADLRDVGQRVLFEILPQLKPAGSDDDGDNLVIAASDLTPSDTAALDTSKVAALCTAQGGPSSHTAIIARTLGMPALVAAGSALLDMQDGQTVVVDGDAGRLYWNVSDDDLESAKAWIKEKQEVAKKQLELALQSAATQDGMRVEVAANVNRPEQVAAAIKAGAEGVGLMRTEFLYLERSTAPSEDEQYEVYLQMLKELGGRPLIIRTLDIGGDKQVPYLNLPHEENPFLGIRGSRLMLRRADLLEPQLRAIYRAAKEIGVASESLSIMFPMITSLSEVIALRADCERIRQQLGAPVLDIGIMIEVPAAAAMAAQLAMHVDFFSIGTNDLTQYVLAIDRQHPELAKDADSLHPAVLRTIDMTVKGALAAKDAGHKCWVGVCGGIAGDPLGAALLVGLGVRELSMSQRDIAPVKAALRNCDSNLLKELANLALNSKNADEVRSLANRLQAPTQIKR